MLYRVISVRQPWASLIADRRRHIIIKTWEVKPGDVFALHAGHGRDDELARKWYGSDAALDKECPKNAILAIVRVRKCMDRGLARPSKFDVSNRIAEPKREYAITVKVIEKLRKSITINAPRPLKSQWQCEV